MPKSNTILGLVFVILGTFLFTNNLFYWNFFSMENFWPIFILIPGLLFEWSYFSTSRNPGLLVPGGILTFLGLLFFFEIFTNWQFSGYTWPIYPLSVAFGLFQLYLFSGRPRGLLIPVFILSTVSVVSFGILFLQVLHTWINFGLLAPIALILVGLFIIFRRSDPISPPTSKSINFEKRKK
ncbi:hypothetical protein [Desulfosporosinus sp. BICA1-9]|uniref:hypothetical protein n=1 Tax=Desulfosporosinus sp. BICA1-9 TaxID=1531958 RepID=UPI0005F11EBD|nr:hypothetical protein [Desulfosporosinus sp. BICA1-9]KJS46414.1 MAG: membrane protein [Peptococcaceae bacterium BRH_c23]KJS84060.1 MAG: membrane protein [Desulfosporosinus sp. BICA1-9]HBW35117.1 hypothetical protein [Desulfosporosinus sp.]